MRAAFAIAILGAVASLCAEGDETKTFDLTVVKSREFGLTLSMSMTMSYERKDRKMEREIESTFSGAVNVKKENGKETVSFDFETLGGSEVQRMRLGDKEPMERKAKLESGQKGSVKRTDDGFEASGRAGNQWSMMTHTGPWLFLPWKKVKVGESWKAALKGTWGGEEDTQEVTVTLKAVNDGVAVIEVDETLKKPAGEEPATEDAPDALALKIRIEFDMKEQFFRSMKTGIDVRHGDRTLGRATVLWTFGEKPEKKEAPSEEGDKPEKAPEKDSEK